MIDEVQYCNIFHVSCKSRWLAMELGPSEPILDWSWQVLSTSIQFFFLKKMRTRDLISCLIGHWNHWKNGEIAASEEWSKDHLVLVGSINSQTYPSLSRVYLSRIFLKNPPSSSPIEPNQALHHLLSHLWQSSDPWSTPPPKNPCPSLIHLPLFSLKLLKPFDLFWLLGIITVDHIPIVATSSASSPLPSLFFFGPGVAIIAARSQAPFFLFPFNFSIGD